MPSHLRKREMGRTELKVFLGAIEDDSTESQLYDHKGTIGRAHKVLLRGSRACNPRFTTGKITASTERFRRAPGRSLEGKKKESLPDRPQDDANHGLRR